MKLVAIWVGGFKKIREQTFNFGSEYTFKCLANRESKTLKIDVHPTSDFFDLYRTEPWIKNVTGIVGSNGSGKSSIVQMLNVIKARKPLVHPVIFIFQQDTTFILKNYQFVTESNRINTILFQTPKGFEYLNQTPSDAPLNGTDILFYSNQFNPEHNDMSLNSDDDLNRALTYQIQKSLDLSGVKGYLENFRRLESGQAISAGQTFNVLNLYESDRLHKLINFLSSVNVKHKPIKSILSKVKFPDEISLWFNEKIFFSAAILIGESKYDFRRLLEIHPFCFETNAKTIDKKDRLRNEIIYQVFFYSFSKDFFMGVPGHELDAMSRFINNLPLDGSIFNKLYDYMMEQKSGSAFSTMELVKHLLTNLENLIAPLTVIPGSSWIEGNIYKIRIDDDLWRFFHSLLRIKSFTAETLFHVQVLPLSSGERALLNQLAEFYDAFRYLESEDVIVSVDEGELYLHPEWQREYINTLFEFFKFFNVELQLNKSFQFLITSHSPFVVSDIPRHNLIFLKRDENGLGKVVESEKRSPTFGGNIFELYNDSFFLTEFISQFAFERINAALKYLKDEKQDHFSSIEEVEAFTKLIGEDLLRTELTRLVHRKKMSDFPSYYQVIRNKSSNSSSSNDYKSEQSDL